MADSYIFILFSQSWLYFFYNSACLQVPDGDQLSKIQFILIDLGNENSSNCFIQRCSVHVNSGSHWQNKPGNLPVHSAVLQQTFHCNGQCCWAVKKSRISHSYKVNTCFYFIQWSWDALFTLFLKKFFFFWGVHLLTWMTLLGQWPWLAEALWCTWKDFSLSEWNRRMEVRWGRAQTGLQGLSPRTSPASSQVWRGRSCPRFCQPQGRWSQKENTCWKMQRRS